MTWREIKFSFVLTALACLPGVVPAEAQADLHAGLIKSRGYVVGSPLAASGLHRYDGDTTWTHIGWNNPRISGVDHRPGAPEVIFLAAGNGVLRTLDGGASWRLATGWEVTESQDISVDPNAPDEVYVGTAYGVWRSRDNGVTWAEANHGIGERYTQAILVDRTRARRLFAATWDGVYLSTDGAGSWDRVGPATEVMTIRQSRADATLWAAGTLWNGVMISRDGGTTWAQATGPVADQSIYSVALHPDRPGILAAAGWETGVLVSEDGGTSWDRRGDVLPTPHFYQVIFDLNQPERLWAATVEEGIFFSDDLGRTWTYGGLRGTLVFDMTFIERSAP
jgi:photosystem II stability/assembly factor-like uncharacterized protein